MKYQELNTYKRFQGILINKINKKSNVQELTMFVHKLTIIFIIHAFLTGNMI